MQSSTAIRMDSLSRDFGETKAVNNLSLEVGRGEIYGLVGPDGAGKSTVMRLLAGNLNVSAGNAWVDGASVIDEAEDVKERIGYMSQAFGLYADLTVLENINFFADIFCVPAKIREPRIDELLEFSQLRPFGNRLAGNLSGGMKQKLSLSCALVHRPRILLLDEPTNGVDPLSRREFWRILYQLLQDDVTIFVSTAYLDEAERCDRIGLLHNGQLLASGTPDEIRELMDDRVILEFETAEPRKAAKVLREMAVVQQANPFGSRVHAITDDPSVAADLTDELRDSGIAVFSTQVIPPSLEDIFVTVVSTREDSGSQH